MAAAALLNTRFAGQSRKTVTSVSLRLQKCLENGKRIQAGEAKSSANAGEMNIGVDLARQL
jgi:hypothetical protein